MNGEKTHEFTREWESATHVSGDGVPVLAILLSKAREVKMHENQTMQPTVCVPQQVRSHR